MSGCQFDGLLSSPAHSGFIYNIYVLALFSFHSIQCEILNFLRYSSVSNKKVNNLSFNYQDLSLNLNR